MSPSSVPEKNIPPNLGVAIAPMTAAMVPAITKVHLEAFAGYMNVRLGSRYVRAFICWFLRFDGAIALAAIRDDGQPLGYVVGAPLGYEKAMSRDLLWVAFTGIALRPWLLWHAEFRATIVKRARLLWGRPPMQHPKPQLAEPIMALVGIGVSSSARGQQIGLRLLRAFEEKAAQLGMRSLELSVYPDNKIARRLYESCGWQAAHGPLNTGEAMHYHRVLREQLG